MRTVTTCLIVLAGLATAAVADPVPPRLAAWLDALPDGVRPDGEARADLEKRVAPAEDPLEAAIRRLRPAYGAAMDVLETDGEEKALPLLEKIGREAPDATTGAYARYRRAEALLLLESAEEALPLLAALAGEKALAATAAEPAVAFLHAFAEARCGDQVAAYRDFLAFLERWPAAPERYRALARQILRELESEYLSPLVDLAGRMKDAARLLERLRTDEPTQEKQKQIVELLEKLVKLAEKMEQQQQGQGQGKSQGSSGPAGGTQSSGPAADSMLPTGPTSIGRLRRVSRGDPDEVWGDLRDKDREEALQFLKERFPGRYHEMLEEYYRALSEGR